mmetsp:Transcript_104065/g.335414  ORF Transcript_104065/g.335414 Transcript_104065/m.335414 type:complete len:434 (+) Transcript_104065:67-1368(+)
MSEIRAMALHAVVVMAPQDEPPTVIDMERQISGIREEQLKQVLTISGRLVPSCSRQVVCKLCVGLLCAVAVLAYSAYRIKESEAQFHELERAKSRSMGNQIMSAVQRQLMTSVSSTKALAALVQLDLGANLMYPLGPDVAALVHATKTVAAKAATGTDAEKAAAAAAKSEAADNIIMNSSRCAFNNVGNYMRNAFNGITNLQLAPSGVVSIISPLADNQEAIGLDLFFDQSQYHGAVATIEARAVVFVGPLVLKQNNKAAIIARFPVFVDQPAFKGPERTFPGWWGFTSMVTEISDLVNATLLPSMMYNGYSYVLYAKAGGTDVFIAASEDVEGQPTQINLDPETPWLTFAQGRQPVSIEFKLSEMEVHWVMLLWPNEGWSTHSGTFPFQLVLCICFFFASLSSVYGVVLRESIIQAIKVGMAVKVDDRVHAW